MKPPTISGLVAKSAALVPASSERKHYLARMIGTPLASVEYLDFGRGDTELYRVKQREKFLFVKLTKVRDAHAIRVADEIDQWVASKGGPSPGNISGFPRELNDGSLISVKNFILGKSILFSDEIAQKLGSQLRVLHESLLSNPYKKKWLAATDQRLERLEKTRNVIHRKSLKPHLGLSTIRTDMLAYGDFILPYKIQRMPTHGDINPGNIIFDGEKIWIIDFEDVFHSYLHPIFDLILILERMCVLNCSEKNQRKVLNQAKIFLNAYGFESSIFTIEGFPEPHELLCALSLRSLLTLSGALEDGFEVCGDEWNKFFGLFDGALKRKDLWRNIFIN